MPQVGGPAGQPRRARRRVPAVVRRPAGAGPAAGCPPRCAGRAPARPPQARRRQSAGGRRAGTRTAGLPAAGSPSDEPFESPDEVAAQATGFLRIPDGPRNAWLFFLSYSNRREFLSGVPVPGVAYAYAPSERFRALVGIPFVALTARPLRPLSLDLLYFPVRTVGARVAWQILRSLRAYAAFDWRNEEYLRAGRPEEADRLFYYEKRVVVGLSLAWDRDVFVDLAGGYAFDRFYFEGEDYDDRGLDRLDLQDGAFARVAAGVRF